MGIAFWPSRKVRSRLNSLDIMPTLFAAPYLQAKMWFVAWGPKLTFAALLASLALVEPTKPSTHLPDLYLQVQTLLKGSRWTEGRLAGMDFQPCRKALDHLGGCARSSQQNSATRKKLLSIRWSLFAGTGQDPTRFRAQALYLLAFQKDSVALDESIHRLNQARELLPHDPRILSDLAAVLAEKAWSESSPLQALFALEAALNSTAQPGAPIEAFFNLALIEDRLNLPGAMLAWDAYLVRDGNSPWATEARARKRSLLSAKPKLDLEPLRLEVVDDLGSLESLSPGDRNARLAQINQKTRTILAQTGDSLLQESVSLLQKAILEKPEQAAKLMAAHRLYSQALKAYNQSQSEVAYAKFARAATLFSRFADPRSNQAKFYQASAQFMMEQYGGSLESLDRLAPEISRKPYWHLIALTGWLRGINLLMINRTIEAREPYLQSIEAARRAASPETESVVLSKLGELSFELGQTEEAWQRFSQALALGSHIHQPKRMASMLNPMVYATQEQGLYRSAELIVDLLMENNRRGTDPFVLLLSLLARGHIRLAAGDPNNAAVDLQEAVALTAKISAPSARERAQADLSILESATTPIPTSGTRQRLDTAIANYSAWDLRTILQGEARNERSRARLLEGDVQGAAADLRETLTILEGPLLANQDPQNRWSLRRLARRTYDQLTRIQLNQLQDPDGTFELTERFKEFSLISYDFNLSRLARRRIPLNLKAFQSRIPAGWLVLSYRLLDDELLTWQVSSTESRLIRRTISASRLRMLVERILAAAGSQQSGSRDDIQELSELLIGDLPAASGLVVIPDQILHSVPFSLLSAKTCSLVDRYPLIVAPSAGTFLEALESIKTGKRTGKTLVISDPAFAEEIFEHFNYLPAALEEGNAVELLHPGAEHLVDLEATSEAFLHRRHDYDLLHIAAHASIHPRKPEQSFLLLAPFGGSSGAVYQGDLYRLKLTAAPLVVLSACDTSTLTGDADDGVSTFARAFLTAGASAVLATLWPVDDSSAAYLTQSFHRELAAGIAPAEALRRAQVCYRENSRMVAADPLGWSAFQLIGASRP